MKKKKVLVHCPQYILSESPHKKAEPVPSEAEAIVAEPVPSEAEAIVAEPVPGEAEAIVLCKALVFGHISLWHINHAAHNVASYTVRKVLADFAVCF